MKATLFADGGSRGNPGPAAFGAVLFDQSGETLREVSEFLGISTNNVAEWSGLIAGLEAALELGVDELEVRLDSELVVRQGGYTWGFLPQWNLFSPPFPQVLGFVCYFISAIAETNRAPFDLAEAESEIVAGYHTEYSSFKFAMFFLGEYASMITVACLATILFLGGWLSPFPQTPGLYWTHYIPTAVLVLAGIGLIIDGVLYKGFGRIELPVLGLVLCALSFLCSRPSIIEGIQGPFWFLGKILVVLFVYVWVRWTLPRFRYDQLMRFGWKFLFPLALLNVVLTSLAVVMRK